MRGSIIKRGKTYSVIIEEDPDPISGKRKQRWYTVHGSGEAEKLRTKLLREKDTGTYVSPTKLTLGEFLETWLTSYVKPKLAPKTYEGRAQQVKRHILPTLGGITLTALKPGQLQNFYAEKLAVGRIDGSGPLSPRTVRDLYGILHAALHIAVKRGLVVRNVAEATDPPSFAHQEMHTLTQEGLRTVLNAARNTQYYALFYTLLFTGLRRSEVLALRWSDTDLSKSTLTVTRAMHHLRTGEIVYRQPKTKTSQRTVSLSKSACLVLRQHRDNEEALKGSLKEDDLVFSHLDGSALLPDSVSHAWMKLVRRCGLKDVRLHDCRHTHASLMFDQGVPAKIISERLGHSSIKVTLDIYTHPAEEVQAAAAARFDELMTPRSENKDIQTVR